MAKELGKHDFYGSCSPELATYVGQQTFSVGCFQWVGRCTSPGYKKGKVKVRVKGCLTAYEAVYAEARRICDLLDKDEYTGPKNVTVGTK